MDIAAALVLECVRIREGFWKSENPPDLEDEVPDRLLVVDDDSPDDLLVRGSTLMSPMTFSSRRAWRDESPRLINSPLCNPGKLWERCKPKDPLRPKLMLRSLSWLNRELLDLLLSEICK